MPYAYTPPANGDQTTQTTQPGVVQQTESAEQKYERLYGQTTQEIKQIREAMTSANPSEELRALRAEIASLRESTKPPVQTAVTPPTRPKWVENLATGDYNAADQALLDSTAASVEARMARKFDEVRSAAYQDALNATHVNLEIDRHVQKLRMENPELAPFEKYLQAPVAQRVEEAKAAGKIKSPVDFIREYTSAIDGEVENLRNLGLVLRGQGKSEAQARNQQVLASTLVTPNPVQSLQTSQGPQQTAAEEPVEDYFARRRSDEARRKGMA
jgi:hypothetical protein